MAKDYSDLVFYHACYGSARPFEPYFREATHIDVDEPKDLLGPGVLVLWGGQDISPAIYNRPVMPETGADDVVHGRDAIEVALGKRAIEMKMPIFGVCRGAQLVCALAGGILVQHVDGHAGNNHIVSFITKERYPYSTVHHQQMYPWKVQHEMLGWTPKLSQVYKGVTAEERRLIKVDPELVWFPEIRAFAVQGHPEFMSPFHPAVELTMELFKQRAQL